MLRRCFCALLISLCLATPALALSDETLRTAFWLSSLSSLGQVGQQSHDGTREINPALARVLWGLGTAMAVYWIASDYQDGIDKPDRTFRVSFTIARW